MRLLVTVLGVSAALACAPRQTRPPTPAPNGTGEHELFGTQLRWEASGSETSAWLKAEIARLETEFGQSMDPDCIWRQQQDGGCPNTHAEQTEKLDAFAAQMASETRGYFVLRKTLKDGREVRDFSGLSQGYFLEDLARRAPGPILVDFAGDLYVAKGLRPTRPLGIGDTLMDRVTYARVHIRSGWMISASARSLGAEVRHPDPPENWREDFERIVLFADESFHGGRLDAWVTALVAGGKPLLEHLESLESHRGQWSWLYFHSDGTVHCAKNLECQLDGSDRLVVTPY